MPDATSIPRMTLAVLTGPTAAGKSELALRIAETLELEILSADSMTVYRRMDIGTAKPSVEDRARVLHHGIDLVDPWEEFDTARFVEHADAAIAAAHGRGHGVLVVGGTPLYLMALLRGFFDGPRANAEVRARLRAREQQTPGSLHTELGKVDREAADRIHPNDLKRIVRALEVFELCGTPISTLQRQFEHGPPRYPYRAAWIALERETLRTRVRARTSAMLDAGLVDEVRAIEAAGGFSVAAGSAIGYRETREFLAGKLAADEFPYRIRSATHRLVRRQETWFRRFPNLTRVPLDGAAETEALDRLKTVLFGAALLSRQGDPS